MVFFFIFNVVFRSPRGPPAPPDAARQARPTTARVPLPDTAGRATREGPPPITHAIDPCIDRPVYRPCNPESGGIHLK